MAKLDVKPTRMELLKLKIQHKAAERGHKLLKDKQDGLMQQFMEIIKEAKKLRREAEEKLDKVFRNFLFASAKMLPKMMESALSFNSAESSLEVTTKNVMSVHIPFFKYHLTGNIVSYGFNQTSAELDASLKNLQEVMPMLVKLAQIEKQAERLAEETEKTRRRVNALEHNRIPALKETIKFITMKLAENERSTIIGTMIIKNKMEKDAA